MNDPIYIYQMGKVGSTSIKNVIDGADHRHVGIGIPHSDLNSGKIITGTRDPAAFTLSSLFENYGGQIRIEGVKQYCHQVIDLMYKRFAGELDYPIKTNVLAPLFWFDEELKRYTDIDVFDYKFTPPYTIIDDRIFIYRLDDIDKLDTPLSEFVNRRVELKHHNQTYNPVYDELKNQFALPKDLQDKIYNHKGYTHFYSC